MAFEQTWRWFGLHEPITLKEIKQTGAVGIVSALHNIPTGEVWPVKDIEERKKIIEAEGFSWSVVESVPVHENIKKRSDNYKQLVENYKQTIRNLGKCGIDTVCYNFMPVLDWSRTDLNVIYKDGSITTKFESTVFAAFDLFILKRKNGEKNYTAEQIKKAEQYFQKLDDLQKKKLQETVLLGLPGSLDTYTLDEFRKALSSYDEIDNSVLSNNLDLFIQEIIPVAEEAGVFMVIHPDDPPFSLLGLPRVVGSKEDLANIINAYDSPSNGLTLCTGSLGSGYKNDLVDIASEFAEKINFVHLRNVKRNPEGDFLEDNHLEGDIDLYEVMKILLLEQKRRVGKGLKNSRMPMRPDHGHLMLPEIGKKGIYPGYSLFGRMRALAELRGMEIGIIRSLKL